MSGYDGNIGVVTDGLVLHLDAANQKSYPSPFTGATWYDMSGNGNHGTLVNGPIFNGSNAGSIQFDGVNDYVYVNNNSDFNGTSGYTIDVSFTCNSFTKNYACLFFKQNNYANYYEQYSLAITVPKLLVFVMTGINRVQKLITFNIEYGIKYNAVAVYDAINNIMKLYLNQNLVGSVVFTTTVDYSTNKILLGGSGILNYGASFDGWTLGIINNVKYYNRALSQQEITQNFNALRGRYNI